MKTRMAKIPSVNTPEAKEQIRVAAELLRCGKLVIFPTETVYGLGGDGTSENASALIYQAKGRPSDNPLILHVAQPSDAERYTYTTPVYDKLAAAFMPGPLTVIMRARDTVPLTVRAGLPTVAVRCPSHPVAHALIQEAGVPIAAPSANLSGKPSPTCFAHVCEDMDGRVDMIIDGGPCEVGLESTIVKIEDDGTLTLLRPGKITPSDLRAVVPEVRIASAVTAQLSPHETVLSPGMKYRHYAPNAPVYLLHGDDDARFGYVRAAEGKCAILSYTDEVDRYSAVLPREAIYPIGDRADLETQAHTLFYSLREADKQNYDRIFAPLPIKEGMGLALYNRLIRAAAYQIVELE